MSVAQSGEDQASVARLGEDELRPYIWWYRRKAITVGRGDGRRLFRKGGVEESVYGRAAISVSSCGDLRPVHLTSLNQPGRGGGNTADLTKRAPEVQE